MKCIFAMASMFLALGLRAQMQPPEWSNVPWPKADYGQFQIWPTTCIGNDIFHLYNPDGAKNKLVAYAWRYGEQPMVRTVDVPLQPGHVNVNGVSAFAGGPVVIYDEWDPLTGKVVFMAQHFDGTLVPDHAPVRLGEVPLDPKSYKGDPLNVKTHKSDDGTKLLIAFDDIQVNNIKLVFNWVLDERLELAWSGAYRLPVRATFSETNYHVSNSGSVLMSVNGEILNEGDTKLDSDGELSTKKYDPKNSKSMSWYLLGAEALMLWDGTIPGLFTEDPTPVWNDDGLYFLTVTRKDPDVNDRSTFSSELVLVEMDGAFMPKVVKQEPFEMGSASRVHIQAVHLSSDRAIIVLFSGAIGRTLAEFDMDMNISWRQDLPYIFQPQMTSTEDAVIVKGMASRGDLEKFMDTGNWVGSKEIMKGDEAIAVRIDRETQAISSQRLAPPTNTAVLSPRTMPDCSCYARMSLRKEPPGMMRTILDQ